MKILIIRNFPSYMDVKYNTYNIQEVGLAKALTRKGHQTDVVFWTPNEEKDEKIYFDENLSIKVFYRHGKNVLKNLWYSNIDNLINEYDIIQTCEYNQIQSWLWAKKYKNKIVIYHGPYFSKFNKKYNAMCKVFDFFMLKRYKKLDTNFIVKSELAKKFLIDKGIKNENITVAGVGIDTQVLTTNEECQLDIYNEMSKNNNILKLLYIGKIEERRNPFLIIDILEKLISMGINTHLYIIGKGESNFVKKVQEYIEKKKMAENITWQEKSEQKYLSCIYKKSDVFLLPTKYEIFGMVLLEAMYYGCTVVTTSNGGSSILIENGKNGLIIDNEDSQKWAEEIIKVEKDKEIKKSISLKAHEKIENEYLWDKLTDKFLSRYNKVKGK